MHPAALQRGVKEARLPGGSVSSHKGPFVRSSGEFETCPDWVPTVDKRRRCARIDLKTMDVCGFDQWANWVAKVRNASRLGSQFSDGPFFAPCIASPASAITPWHWTSQLRPRRAVCAIRLPD